MKQALTKAVLSTGVRLIANVTDAAIASYQILTNTVLANVWIQGALINV